MISWLAVVRVDKAEVGMATGPWKEIVPIPAVVMGPLRLELPVPT